MLDANCAGVEVIFHVDTAEEAETCRKQLVDNALPTVEVCAVGQLPDETAVCRDGGILAEAITVPNCSADKLEQCMALICAAPGCSWTPGACDP